MVNYMTPEVKKRIEDINNGVVPEGYHNTRIGIVSENWKLKKIKDCVKLVERPVILT